MISADRDRLDRMELVPFRAAIDEGVDAVMTAHVAMPTLLGEDAPPATLAPELMTGLLRDEMGFHGLLFTDALRMGAITAAYGAGEAGVMALEAGSDVLLAPSDIDAAIDAVAAAIRSGRITRTRVEQSARKILEFKARAGLHRQREVDLGGVSSRVGTGEHLAMADQMASRSITLPRDSGALVPVDPGSVRSVLSVTWARDDDLLAGGTFDPLLSRYLPGVERVRVGPGTGESAYAELAGRARSFGRVVISAYVPPRSGAGSVAVPPPFADFVGRVDRSGAAVVISFGSPYLLTAFPDLGSYMVAWGDREVAQKAAVRALVGETAIEGRMPVSIPPSMRSGLGCLARHVTSPYGPPGILWWRPGWWQRPALAPNKLRRPFQSGCAFQDLAPKSRKRPPSTRVREPR